MVEARTIPVRVTSNVELSESPIPTASAGKLALCPCRCIDEPGVLRSPDELRGSKPGTSEEHCVPLRLRTARHSLHCLQNERRPRRSVVRVRGIRIDDDVIEKVTEPVHSFERDDPRPPPPTSVVPPSGREERSPFEHDDIVPHCPK